MLPVEPLPGLVDGGGGRVDDEGGRVDEQGQWVGVQGEWLEEKYERGEIEQEDTGDEEALRLQVKTEINADEEIG